MSSGCSTTLVPWLTTPGTRILPGGSFTSCHTFHSCSWRGLAASMRYAPAFTFRIRSTILRERHVGGMWPGPATPAHVIADAILGNALERVVENVDVPREPLVVLVEGPRRHHAVVRHRGPGIVHLQQETGIDDRAVLGPQGFGERDDEIFVALVVLVLPVGNRARRCGDRQEGLVDAGRLRRGLQVVDVALQFEEAVVRDRADADRILPRDVRPVLAVAASFEFGVELCEALAVRRLAQTGWRP